MGLYHCIDTLQGDIQGFFAYYVLAGLGCGNGRLHMKAARRGDSNNIYLLALEHIFIIVEGLNVEFIRKIVSSLGYLVAAAD